MTEGGPLSQPIDTYLPALASVFEEHGVVLAYLYGSQARGNAGPLSDVDMAVLFRAGLSRLERGRRRVALISALADVLHRSDVFVVDLAGGSPLVRNKVRREGQVLYRPDDAIRVDFETTALRDYVDTEPEALAYLNKFKITYPNGPDLGTRISQTFRIRGVPETYFVDREGNRAYAQIGPFSSLSQIRGIIEPLLGP